jgi:hypothetical protein
LRKKGKRFALLGMGLTANLRGMRGQMIVSIAKGAMGLVMAIAIVNPHLTIYCHWNAFPD